jgi:outer membrane autotransporter protein
MRQQKFKRKVLAQAIAVACFSISASSNALAALISCPTPDNGVITVADPTAQSCYVGADMSLVVTSSGEINNGGGHAVIVDSGSGNAGSISNSGTISGRSGSGINILANSSSANASVGTITNSGTITGSNSGINISANSYSASASVGTITNNGTITGASSGVNISASYYYASASVDSITNSANGTISGQGNNGINISASSSASASVDSITNSANGTISGQGNNGINILANSTSASASVGTITNSGTITGANSGINISANSSSASASVGTITNSGTITGAGDGINISASRSARASVDSITNNAGGTISGSSAGIRLSTDSSASASVGGIVNSGTITGYTGIAVNSGSRITDGITNNAGGIIRGTGGTAIDLVGAGAAITVNNSGVIDGALKLGEDTTSVILLPGPPIPGPIGLMPGVPISVPGPVVLAPAHTLNLNGGSITGEVTGGQSSVVNVNGTFTTGNIFNVGHFDIKNGGLLNMEHGITVASSTGLKNDGTLSVAAGKTATINGNYVQGTTGVFETGASSETNYGKLVVNGTADLSASNKLAVKVSPSDTLRNGAVLNNVLQSSGTLNAGALSVADNSALWNFTAATNDSNGIDVTSVLAPVPAPTPAPTPESVPAPTPLGTTGMINNTGIGRSSLGAAGVIDNFLVAGNATGGMQTVLNALGALPTQAEVAGAVMQMAPLVSAGTTQTTMKAMQGVNNVVQGRMDSGSGLSSGDEYQGSRHAWVKPFGSWADQKDRNGVPGYEADIYGLVLGTDKELSKSTRAGVAFAYSHSKVDGNSTIAVQRSKVDTYQAIVYGTHSIDDRTEVHLQADIGTNKNSGSRVINFGGINRTASSNYDSLSAHVGAGISQMVPVAAKTTFVPSVRADYTYLRDAAFTESGADALNLKVNRNSTDELILAVDGKLIHALSDATKLTANLGAGYDALSSRSSITASFVGGGAAFRTEGMEPSPWLMRGGLGVVVNNANGLEVSTSYDIEARKGFTNQTASIKFRLPF